MFLAKVQDGLQTQLLMSSGIGIHIRLFFFPQKGSGKRNHSIFPIRAPIWTAFRLLGIFYVSLKLVIKISLNKETFPFSQKPQERNDLSCSLKAVALWKQTSFQEPCLKYPSWSPVNQPSLQFPLIELFQTETLHFQSPLHRSLKVLVNEPTSSLPPKWVLHTER